jgi:hypothetical protein
MSCKKIPSTGNFPSIEKPRSDAANPVQRFATRALILIREIPPSRLASKSLKTQS